MAHAAVMHLDNAPREWVEQWAELPAHALRSAFVPLVRTFEVPFVARAAWIAGRLGKPFLAFYRQRFAAGVDALDFVEAGWGARRHGREARLAPRRRRPRPARAARARRSGQLLLAHGPRAAAFLHAVGKEDLGACGARLVERHRAYFIASTVRREAPRVGRNDPCPCGSGKKHKKCGGA